MILDYQIKTPYTKRVWGGGGNWSQMLHTTFGCDWPSSFFLEKVVKSDDKGHMHDDGHSPVAIIHISIKFEENIIIAFNCNNFRI